MIAHLNLAEQQAKALASNIKRGVLTTGQAAKLCRVAIKTLIKWCDRGGLKAYRIPCSNDRRIEVVHLVEFMKAKGLPIPEELVPKPFLCFSYGFSYPGIERIETELKLGIRIANVPFDSIKLAVIGTEDGGYLNAIRVIREFHPKSLTFLVLSADDVINSYHADTEVFFLPNDKERLLCRITEVLEA